MKRRTFLSLMGAAALTSSMMLTGCGAGSGDDRKIVRIGHVQSQTHPDHLGLEAFANYINEKLGDKYRVEVYPSELLGSQTEMVQLTQTGAMAKDLGLVDELGGIDKALNAAATQAGIENYSIIGYPEKENIFASLLGNQKKHYINSEIKEYLGSYYNSFKALENIKDANCIQARMPFDPNIQ